MARLHVTISHCWDLTVIREEDDGTRQELPVTEYRIFSSSYLAGDHDQILFECWYNDQAEPDDEQEGRYATVLLQCVRSDTEEIVYYNQTDEPLWVRNGAQQPSSPRIDPGQSLCHPFCPDPPLPPWQVPENPEQEQWQETTVAALAGMHITPETQGASICWDQVQTYGVKNGRIFWFDKEGWRNLGLLSLDWDWRRENGLPPRLPAAELRRLRTLTFARQGQTCGSSSFRRPLVWMRGRTVTPDQAREVIRRCDRFFQPWTPPGQEEAGPPDPVSVELLESSLFTNGAGWCRPDGRIGVDRICRIKDVFEEEIISDGCDLMEEFPFLDLFFLFWACEEEEPFTPGQMAMHGMPQPEFGVRFHDRRVEFYAPHDAWETFCDFQARYGDAPETYEESEMKRRGIAGLDRACLDRCLRDNGMDPAAWDWTPAPPSRYPADPYLPLRYQTLRQACARRGRTWPEPDTAKDKEESR